MVIFGQLTDFIFYQWVNDIQAVMLKRLIFTISVRMTTIGILCIGGSMKCIVQLLMVHANIRAINHKLINSKTHQFPMHVFYFTALCSVHLLMFSP